MTPRRNLVDAVHVTVRPTIQTHVLASGKRYRVKWVVAGADKTRSFERLGLAEEFQADLRSAMSGRRREEFDRTTGLPLSMLLPETGISFLDLAVELVAAEWTRWSPANRRARVDALSDLAAEFVSPGRGKPSRELLRRWARDHVLPPEGKRMEIRELRLELEKRVVSVLEQQKAGEWLIAHSRPVSELADLLVVEQLLNAVSVSPQGSTYGPDTQQRQRSSVSLVCALAVKRKELATNPVRDTRRSIDDEAEEVDPAFVPTPAQARALVAEVAQVSPVAQMQYCAFLTLLWTTGMRPSEASGILNNSDLVLPSEPGAWGRVTLRRPTVATGARWTTAGTVHEDRDRLKARKRKATRLVLLPPEAVDALRGRIEDAEVKRGERLFTNSHGSPINPSAMSGVWRKARLRAFPDGEFASLRVYDLRHTAASVMLNAGVPVPRVAQQLGNSPATLMRVYARLMSTDDKVFMDSLDRALGEAGGR